MDPLFLFLCCCCCCCWLLCLGVDGRRVVRPDIVGGDTSSRRLPAADSTRPDGTAQEGEWGRRAAAAAAAAAAAPVPAAKAADFEVHDLPMLKEKPPFKHYAGLLPNSGGDLFYWLVESTGDPKNDPLLIWLNGGPGCSSMDGMFLENGPFKLSSDAPLTVSLNPYAWNSHANVMYLDQPVGTGLSVAKKNGFANDESGVDVQFYEFMQNFLRLHDRYLAEPGRSRPIYFSGESHAGHYIPSMIAHVLDMNDKVASGDAYLDVQGAAIGNGWTDPYRQYDPSEFLFGMGLISAGQYATEQVRAQKCLDHLDKHSYSSQDCFDLLDRAVAAIGGLCIYDVRLFNVEFPPGKKQVESYMNDAGVRAALHVADDMQTFQECADDPYLHLSKWDGLGVTSELALALDADVRFLFFNGQYDLICNHVGNEKFLQALEWKGADAYRAADQVTWNHGSKVSGMMKTANNGLSYLMVLDAGHMVPMNVPEAAQDMIERFLQGTAFGMRSQAVDLPVTAGPWPFAPSTPGAPVQPPAPLSSPVITKVETSSESARISFSTTGGGSVFMVSSSPGGITSQGDKSPLVVDGLEAGTAYTFTVVTIEGDRRSEASLGSEAVTPGCSPSFTVSPCGEGKICMKDAVSGASCVCVGSSCAVSPSPEQPSGSEVPPPPALAMLDPTTLPTCTKGHTCHFGFDFFFAPGAIGGEPIVRAVLASAGPSEWHQREAFSEALVADVAMGLDMDYHSLHFELVQSAERIEGDTDLAMLPLKIRIGIDTSDDAILQKIPLAWNDPSSKLHSGLLTSRADFGRTPQVGLLEDFGPDASGTASSSAGAGQTYDLTPIMFALTSIGTLIACCCCCFWQRASRKRRQSGPNWAPVSSRENSVPHDEL